MKQIWYLFAVVIICAHTFSVSSGHSIQTYPNPNGFPGTHRFRTIYFPGNPVNMSTLNPAVVGGNRQSPIPDTQPILFPETTFRPSLQRQQNQNANYDPSRIIFKESNSVSKRTVPEKWLQNWVIKHLMEEETHPYIEKKKTRTHFKPFGQDYHGGNQLVNHNYYKPDYSVEDDFYELKPSLHEAMSENINSVPFDFQSLIGFSRLRKHCGPGQKIDQLGNCRRRINRLTSQ